MASNKTVVLLIIVLIFIWYGLINKSRVHGYKKQSSVQKIEGAHETHYVCKNGICRWSRVAQPWQDKKHNYGYIYVRGRGW
jgi:hypothetical protein